MRKVVVFGLGRFGASVATRLYEEGIEVLAIDENLDLVERIKDQVTVAVTFDATIRENIEAYGVSDMDAAVVAIGTDFEAAVLITVLCQELEIPLVVAKALNHLQERVLRSVGAHQVVLPEEEMGHRLAAHLLHESVVDFVELPQGFSLRRIDLPTAWVGRSLAELELLGKEQLNLIQIVRQPGAEAEGEPVRIPLPHGETLLQAGDRIDVIGPDAVLDRYI